MDNKMFDDVATKSAAVGDELTAFAALSKQLTDAIDAKNSIKAVLVLLETGKQARTLADKLFEFSEIIEDLEESFKT